MMHVLKADKIDTYSIGFGAGYEQFNELEMARKFADQYNTNHHEITVRPDVSDLFPELITQLDEPLAD
jgi:asparagine synthase (glutamine-hydrolysing)